MSLNLVLVSLITLHPTTWLILTSLLTVNITPLKLRSYDHLINAIGSRKISCLCLFDLSAAFDTIDHNILLTRPSSWFGIHSTVLNWFRSYLSFRCFRVKCNNDFSSLHTCLCGVPQGSVLGPLLFVMYTTPLSTLVSSLSLNQHLYADDTQLFLSLHTSDFHSNISHLQNALQQISSG